MAHSTSVPFLLLSSFQVLTLAVSVHMCNTRYVLQTAQGPTAGSGLSPALSSTWIYVPSPSPPTGAAMTRIFKHHSGEETPVPHSTILQALYSLLGPPSPPRPESRLSSRSSSGDTAPQRLPTAHAPPEHRPAAAHTCFPTRSLLLGFLRRCGVGPEGL